MTIGKTYIKLYLVVLLSAIFEINGISQTAISGIINKYAKVISVDNVLKDRVIVDAPLNFVPGDTVLIIQMKGAIIDTVNTLIYPINGTGKYEFIQVSTVNNSTGVIVFTNKFLNNYDSGEAIQLVKVPSYNAAKVTGPITCLPWDGNKGGIVSFFVLDTLELGADIDVSGKGFIGADPVQYTGICDFGIRYYTNPVAGKKGEGIVGKYFNKLYGKGFFGNGGGGGNGLYAGGGGGGGVGQGSRGNRMSCTDPTNKTGGEPGLRLSDYFNWPDYDHKDRIFFGGGGGSGTYPIGSTSAKGGNGGGIVFILTRYLKNPGNQYIIKANGGDAANTATTPAGTGGGGGGGNILISAEQIIGNLKAELKGGNGGGNSGIYCSGQGGGGGGGFIWYTNPITGFPDTTGGQRGDNKNTYGCNPLNTEASFGFSLNGLNPVLNGFLFNLIGETHTICYAQPSKSIIGTAPRGGNGIYTFLWQKRKYNIPAWTNIPGANSQNYTAPLLNDSTYFRRVVTTTKKNASGVDVLMTDTSKVVLVKVIPQIKNNSITPGYIEICSGQAPVQLIGGSVTRQGDPSPTYFWKTHKPRATWVDGTIPNSTKDYSQTDYTTSNVSDTTYYHRIVSSSICKDTTTATIIVHPILKNDSIWVKLDIWNRQEVCNGSTPKQISGTIPIGGKSGTYSYRWEKSTDAQSWSLQIDSSSNLNVNFSPGSLTQTINYRRIVYSGLNSVCKDTSNSFLVKVWPKIANNTIFSSQSIICEETSPNPFVNSLPTGGNEPYYSYQWIKSPINKVPWDSITISNDINKYPDSTLSVAASFKRVVRSGLYDCCKDSSNTISFLIQPKFRNDSISKDSTLCINQQPNLLGPRKNYILYGGKKPYKYQWYQRINNSKTWSLATNDSVMQPGILNDTSYFRRIVISSDDVCKDTAKVIIIVLPAISNNIISGDNAVCNDSTLAQIKGVSGLAGGDKKYTYVWDYKPANGNWFLTTVATPGYPSTKLTNVNDSSITTFRRRVYSGLHDCCVDSSTTGRLEVKAYAPPKTGGVLRDTSITFDFTYTLIAPKPKLGRGVWALVGYNPQPEYKTDTTAKVTFPNPEIKYKIQWIITTNEVCPSKIDSFNISVKDIGRYNGFSPNGDNKNDYFIVKGLQNLNDIGDYWELKILNRWGGLVYSSDIKNNRLKQLKDIMPYSELGLPIWDGKNQNDEELAEDTYYYVLSITKKKDKLREYKGFVMLKR